MTVCTLQALSSSSREKRLCRMGASRTPTGSRGLRVRGAQGTGRCHLVTAAAACSPGRAGSQTTQGKYVSSCLGGLVCSAMGQRQEFTVLCSCVWHSGGDRGGGILGIVFKDYWCMRILKNHNNLKILGFQGVFVHGGVCERTSLGAACVQQ